MGTLGNDRSHAANRPTAWDLGGVPTVNVAPIMNDYKWTFFWHRLSETVLGGLKLFNGDCGPPAIYISQILLFFVPFIIGIALTLVADSENFMGVVQYQIIGGGIIFLFAFALQLFVRHLSREPTNSGPATSNFLVDDLEASDLEGCFNMDTFRFLFSQRSLAQCFLLSLIAGSVCGGAIGYLRPSASNNSLSGSGYAFLAIGWFVICLTVYPLMARSPAEPSQFRTYDFLGLGAAHRAFYVGAIMVANAILVNSIGESSATSALRIIFLTIPLLSILGILPPPDALVPYILEQLQIRALGGSPASTDFRLFILFSLSCCSVAAVFLLSFYEYPQFGLFVAAALGLMLSQNFSGQSSAPAQKDQYVVPFDKKDRLCPHKGLSTPLFTVSGASVVIGIAVALHFGGIENYHTSFSTSTVGEAVRAALDAVLSILLIVLIASTQLQRAFVLSIFSNPLYSFSKKSKLFVRTYRICTSISRIVLFAYFLLFTDTSGDQSSGLTFIKSVFALRSMRWLWQATPLSLLETTVGIWITRGSPVSGWAYDLPLNVQFFVLGLVISKGRELFDKLFFVLVSFSSSLTHKKLRFPHVKLVTTLSIVLSPIILVVILISVGLSAPLLPLFGLPVFILGFPRPLRCWPTAGASFSPCDDTMYYRHLLPSLSHGLAKSITNGGLGIIDPSRPQFFLLRHDALMIWVQVLESGLGHCTVVIKGLELQTTSCHSVEATRIDEVLEGAFSDSKPLTSQHKTHTLRPMSEVKLHAYSVSNNQLTGIIDNPDVLKSVPDLFMQCLVWMLFTTVPRDIPAKWLRIPFRTHELEPLLEGFPHDFHSFMLQRKPVFSPRPNSSASASRRSSGSANGAPPIPSLPSAQTLPPLVGPSSSSIIVPSRPISSGFSVIEQSEDPSTPRMGISAKSEGLGFGFRPSSGGGGMRLNINTALEEGDDVDDLLESLTASPGNFTRKTVSKTGNSVPPVVTTNPTPFMQPQMMLRPSNPLTLSLDSTAGASPMASRQVQYNPENSRDIRNPLVRVALACFSVIELSGAGLDRTSSATISSGAYHILNIFQGKLPPSLGSDWLDENPELKDLVVQSFRYAFKLAYDQMAVYACELSHEEIDENLLEFQSKWFFGQEGSEWSNQVMKGREFLFSIGKNENVYTGHMLSLQDLTFSISSMNGEVIRSLWSSLSLELLYCTNDDEERYSIQAHPLLMRNITIHAAEPPLGYPIFATNPLVLPV